jgi:hypothetical protein
MPGKRWLDQTQPQTLQVAVMLLYFSAAFSLLFILLGAGIGWLGLLIVVGQIGGGFGIANEKRWGYGLAIVVAILSLALLFLNNPFAGTNIVSLMFEVALVALLLHPQSREYQRIWFK